MPTLFPSVLLFGSNCPSSLHQCFQCVTVLLASWRWGDQRACCGFVFERFVLTPSIISVVCPRWREFVDPPLWICLLLLSWRGLGHGWGCCDFGIALTCHKGMCLWLIYYPLWVFGILVLLTLSFWIERVATSILVATPRWTNIPGSWTVSLVTLMSGTSHIATWSMYQPLVVVVDGGHAP